MTHVLAAGAKGIERCITFQCGAKGYLSHSLTSRLIPAYKVLLHILW